MRKDRLVDVGRVGPEMVGQTAPLNINMPSHQYKYICIYIYIYIYKVDFTTGSSVYNENPIPQKIVLILKRSPWERLSVGRYTLAWDLPQLRSSETVFTCLFSVLNLAGVLTALLPRHLLPANSRFTPSQWDAALICNDVSHWWGASLVSALYYMYCQISNGNWNNLNPSFVLR